MTIRRFYRRRFLNRPRHHMGAHVIAEVSVEHYTEEPWTVVGRIHLADCYHHIDLNFDAGSLADAGNALRKIAILRETLDGFETALVAAIDEARERNTA